MSRFRAGRVEATSGFEPENRGFADASGTPVEYPGRAQDAPPGPGLHNPSDVQSDVRSPRCCTGPVIHVPRLAVTA